MISWDVQAEGLFFSEQFQTVMEGAVSRALRAGADALSGAIKQDVGVAMDAMPGVAGAVNATVRMGPRGDVTITISSTADPEIEKPGETPPWLQARTGLVGQPVSPTVGRHRALVGEQAKQRYLREFASKLEAAVLDSMEKRSATAMQAFARTIDGELERYGR